MTRHAKDLPSVEYIHECFDYDKDSGICTWKERPLHHYSSESMMNRVNKQKANTIIDQKPHSNGYLYLTLNDIRYSLHRLIWKHVTHSDPAHSIDHIDNNPLNNKWENLREATVTNNNSNRNTQLNSDKKKGVSYRKSTNRYRSQIQDNGITYELGTFLTEDEAYAAYCTAARELHGEFANYGNHTPIFDEAAPSIYEKRKNFSAELSLEYINQCVEYNEYTGELTWKKRPAHHFKSISKCNEFNNKYPGKVISGISGNGYIAFKANDIKNYAHRVIWKLMTGDYPKQTIEHIDGNKLNNRWENLRELTISKKSTDKTELADLSLEYLKECIDYNPETGIAVWKERPLHHFKNISNMISTNSQTAGKEINTINTHGYYRFTIDYSTYLLHRVIWKLMTGKDSEHYIDHKDGNKINNKWENIRESTPRQNMQNTGKKSHNTSGYKGVQKGERDNTWKAVIRDNNGKDKYLGIFPTPEDAHKAYCEAASAYHGEFANYG